MEKNMLSVRGKMLRIMSRIFLPVIVSLIRVSSLSAGEPLVFSDMPDGTPLDASTHSGVSSVRYGNLDYMPSGSFKNLPELEEIVFDGMIGHIDGYMISNCPKLKRVVFNGPILSTGGAVFASNCPELEEIEINGLAFGFYIVKNPDCPSLKEIKVNGAVVSSGDSLTVAQTDISAIKDDPALLSQFHRLVDWQINHMGDAGFKGYISKTYVEDINNALMAMGETDRANELSASFAAHRGDFGKTKLEILKESAPYAPYEGAEDLRVSYASPTDSMLTRSRDYFNLDSIAGAGDDVSRIKKLLYWVHDLVRHDGSSSWPDCEFNLVDLYETCRDGERGLNCRFMAMMLAEALLAEGIPARYLTCQSKDYANDSDCHVITVAWAESLGKWVWVDPTFAAYVTDENGLMLHPGEVRYRLQHDLPLVLNEDANWNHQSRQTKENYLENYMAKNLYIIDTNLLQQSAPEGSRSPHPVGKVCSLVPAGFNYNNAHYVISDEELFWAAPERTVD